MRDEISQAIKDAMKSGDKRRLATLRLVSAAIKDRDIAAQLDGAAQPSGRDRISDAELLQLLQKMVKQRREAAETYRQGGRPELADQELQEIVVIEEFLPRQMDEAETRAAAGEVVRELGCAGLKDMGRVMAALKERYPGKMDFAKASGIVKELLK
ncbi:MAG: GatB/YqeY domain-containing protein [Rhodobacteraceae bacterium]|nr:GatB/YqeY domain-containing protein [Paracoccaceae bacterium]